MDSAAHLPYIESAGPTEATASHGTIGRHGRL